MAAGLVLLGIFLVVITVILLLHNILKVREKEQENRLLQSYMLGAEEFYTGIQARMEATRHFRHDLAKHIQTLEILLQEKKGADTQGVQEYMENLKERYAGLSRQEFCQDELVNSILLMKSQQCREKGIPFYVQVQDCRYTGIKAADLVGLLQNLLDNAIEANERIAREEEREIRLKMSLGGGKLFLEMENAVRKGEKVNFITQKKQKEEHGIGTKIIESLVEKYQGTRFYETDVEHCRFSDKIVLRQEE